MLYLTVADRAPSTIESYARTLERLSCVLGNLEVRKISCKKLVSAVADLQLLQVKGRRRNPTTMNGIKSAIRSFFKWASEAGLCKSNPSLILRISRHSSARTEPINTQEIEQLLHTIRISNDKNRLRDETLFATYAYTGIRRIEALELSVSDINLAAGSLYIAKPKGGPSRNQPIPRQLSLSLEKYLTTNHRDRQNSATPLFPGRTTGAHLSAKQAWVRFEKWKKRSGIRKELTPSSTKV